MAYINLGAVTGPLLKKCSILLHFAGQKAGFRTLTSQYFYIVAWKQFQNVPTVRNNGLIYGLHHFGGVSGPLLKKYSILVHFAGQKAGFRTLTSQYFDIVAWKQFQNVPTVRNNGLIYGLHHFGGSYWAVIEEMQHFGPFCGPKSGFSDPYFIVL